MEHALQSPTVQKALPDLAGLNDTLGFDGFLAKPPPTISADPRAIREHLRGYAVQLDRHERFTELWQQQYHNQLVTLRQLITAYDVRCGEVDHDAIFSDSQMSDLEQRKVGLAEFEDLYYFLACKTKTLYADLQLRFASDFISMDFVLHHRGTSSYAHVACTVRDMRNFLRAVWFHLLHPVIVRSIEAAINQRKYQTLKANPLLPKWDDIEMTQRDRQRISHFQLGHNLDASTMESMFESLEDVSTMSVPALLMKVSRRGIGGYPADALHSPPLKQEQYNHQKAVEQAWIDLAAEDENYLRQQIVEADMDDMPSYERELSQGYLPREHVTTRDEQQATAPVHPVEPISPFRRQDMSWAGHSAPERGGNPELEHITRVGNVNSWLPNVISHELRSPLSSISAGTTPFKPSPRLPSSNKSGSSVPSTPSHYRMPFHGFTEFRHEVAPPPPPPKSPPLLAVPRPNFTDRGHNPIQTEDTRLQDALQQVQQLQRENSNLQERLSMTSPPRGLFRRLSKGGSKSPKKSPRRSILHGISK